MNSRTLLLLTALVAHCWSTPSAAQTLDKGVIITGRQLQAIQAVMAEFDRYGQSLNDYEIAVVEDLAGFSISFLALERPPGWRGATPGRHEFTAVVSKSDLKILQIVYPR